MKTILLLTSLAILLPTIVFGQNLKDKLTYKVTYKLTYTLDSTNFQNKKSEYMILYTGDELSVFSSRAKTLANPIVTNGFSGHSSRTALTQFHYEILKDRASQKIYYILKIPKMKQDWFYYEEPTALIEWEIKNETKDIKGYKTQKATTSFAGRDYIAWFAPEIPISDGPYKFSGLPGLILEIQDSEGEWVFTFFSLEKLSPPQAYKLNLKQYIKTEKEELLKLWLHYRKDPMGYANNPNVKIDPAVQKKYEEAFTKMLEKENNPMELE